MAEYGYAGVQTIPGGQDAVFFDIIPCKKGYVLHREGSGLLTVKGITSCPCAASARYSVMASTNIAVSEGGTPGEISIAIAINGEAVPTSLASVTPAAAGDFWNVTCIAQIDAPIGCCTSVTIKNTTDPSQSIDMRNLNIKVEKVA